MTTDKPTLDDVAGLSPQLERLLTALWDCQAQSFADIQANVPALASVKPATLEKYARTLGERLESSKRGWVEFGSSVTFGRWVRLNRNPG